MFDNKDVSQATYSKITNVYNKTEVDNKIVVVDNLIQK